MGWLTTSDWGAITGWGTHEHSDPSLRSWNISAQLDPSWCGWSCLQPLHVLVASNRSLKIAGVLDHLALQSCIALLCWMGPLLELLLDSRRDRVDLTVGCWGGYHCHIRAVSWIGTDISKMTLLFIVVALPISQSSCHILVALGWGQ
jgi:hypothetical protein